MKQFGKIFSFELKYYLKNKIFIGVTIFLVLVIGAVMFFPQIKAQLVSDSSETVAEKEVMLIGGDSDWLSFITEAFSAVFDDYEVKASKDSLEKIKAKITDGEAECAFVLSSLTEYTYYVNNLSMYDMNTALATEALQNAYRMSAMVENGIAPQRAEEIMTVAISGTTESLGVDQMQNYWYTYIMIFALYMVILLYGQMVATNVATEKSSKAMELLITSAKPVSMMFGKVLASCLAGLMQLVAIFGSAILFYSINKKHWGDNEIVKAIFDMPTEVFGFMLLFFILGFLIYAFMFGAVGSTASKLEDINTSVMPITLLFIIGFMAVMFSLVSSNVDTALMKACSFIPFTSPMAMFTRIAMSNVPVMEIIISVAILIGSVIGVGFISAKIYRVGVLLYGTTPKIGSILKAVFKS